MEYSVNHLISSEFRQPTIAAASILETVTATINEIQKAYFKVRYWLTPTQMEVVKDLFGDSAIFAPTKKTKIDHPVLKIVQNVLTEEISTMLKGSKRPLLIGATYKDFKALIIKNNIRDFVAIMGNVDIRDLTRYEEGKRQALKDLTKIKDALYLFMIKEYLDMVESIMQGNEYVGNYFVCASVYDQIIKPCDFFIARDSLYDITPTILNDYLQHYRVRQGMATLLTCPALVNNKAINDSVYEVAWSRKKYYHLKGEFATMQFTNGVSNGYAHELSNFMSWNYKSLFPFQNYALYAERVKAYGSYQLLQIFRVPNKQQILTRRIEAANKQWVKLFDVIPWLRYGEAKPKDYFMVDREKFYAIYNFCVRQASESYDPSKIAAYAHTKTSTLRIAAAVVQKQWECDAWTLDKTCQFALLLAMFRRGENFGILLESLSASKKGGEVRDLIPGHIEGWWRMTKDFFYDSPFGKFLGLSTELVTEYLEDALKCNYSTEDLYNEFDYKPSGIIDANVETPLHIDQASAITKVSNEMFEKSLPLEFTAETLYSYTHRRDLDIMLAYLQARELKIKVIAEANANVGITAMYLQKQGYIVHSYENNEETYKLLVNNLKGTNMAHTLADATKVKFTEDMILFDPPWGGRNAPIQGNMMLYLGGKPIFTILLKLMSNIKYRPILVLKIPKAMNNIDIVRYKYVTERIHGQTVDFMLYYPQKEEIQPIIIQEPVMDRMEQLEIQLNEQTSKTIEVVAEVPSKVSSKRASLEEIAEILPEILRPLPIVPADKVYKSKIHRFAELCADRTFQKYLDFGCGDLKFTLEIASTIKAKVIWGIDPIKPLSLERLRMVNYLGALEELREKDFDLISANMSLHHISEITEIITEFANILKIDGYVYLREHDFSSELINKSIEEYHKGFKDYHNYPNTYPRTKQAMLQLFQNNGFVIVDEEHDKEMNPLNIYCIIFQLKFKKEKKKEKVELIQPSAPIMEENSADETESKLIRKTKKEKKSKNKKLKDPVYDEGHSFKSAFPFEKINWEEEDSIPIPDAQADIKHVTIKPKKEIKDWADVEFSSGEYDAFKNKRFMLRRSLPTIPIKHGTEVNSFSTKLGQFKCHTQLIKEQLENYETLMKVKAYKEWLASMEGLAKCHDKVVKFIEDARMNLAQSPSDSAFEVEATVWNALAGAGKTSAAIARFNPSTDAYIVTTNENRKDVTTKLRRKHKGTLAVWTYEVALSKKELIGFKRIWLDECFTLPFCYIAALFSTYRNKQFYLLGDVNQCNYFESGEREWTAMRDFISGFNHVEIKKDSMRVGQTIVDILSAVVPGYGLKTALGKTLPARDTNVEVYTWKAFERDSIPKADLHITPSRKTVEMLETEIPIITVRTGQGSEASSVNLYLSNNDINLMHKSNIFIVAMTRAVDKLNIIETQKGVLPKLPLEFLVTLDKVRPFAEDTAIPTGGKEEVDEIEPEKTIKSADFSAKTLQDIIGASVDNVYQAHHVALPKSLKVKYSMNPDELVAKKVFNYKMFSQTFYGRSFRVSSTAQANATSLNRLSEDYKIKLTKGFVDRAVRNFRKMFLKEQIVVKEIGQIWANAQAEVVDKYHKSPFVTSESFKIDSPMTTEGHLKTITKIYVNDFDKINNSGKAGQPITAWPKEFNVIYAPLFNAMQEILRMSLKTNTLYGNGYSEVELKARVQMLHLETRNKNKTNMFCADFPQFDASQGAEIERDQGTINLEAELVTQLLGIMVGDCSWLFPLFYQLRRGMPMFMNSISVMKNGDRDSGAPDTFFGNSLVNMGLHCGIIEPHEYVAGAFGGDDSAVWVAILKEEYLRRWQANGIKLKLESVTLPIFFNHFLYEGRMIYDPLRLCWSIFSKNFFRSSIEDTIKYITEIQQAVADKLKEINANVNDIEYCLRKHYMMPQSQVDAMMQQLNAFILSPPMRIYEELDASFTAEI